MPRFLRNMAGVVILIIAFGFGLYRGSQRSDPPDIVAGLILGAISLAAVLLVALCERRVRKRRHFEELMGHPIDEIEELNSRISRLTAERNELERFIGPTGPVEENNRVRDIQQNVDELSNVVATMMKDRFNYWVLSKAVPSDDDDAHATLDMLHTMEDAGRGIAGQYYQFTRGRRRRYWNEYILYMVGAVATSCFEGWMIGATTNYAWENVPLNLAIGVGIIYTLCSGIGVRWSFERR